jgi:hypothetical protein
MSRVEYSGLSNVSATIAMPSSANLFYHILLATYHLLYIRLSRTPNQYTFTLKMATAMFAGHPQTPKLHIDDEI